MLKSNSTLDVRTLSLWRREREVLTAVSLSLEAGTGLCLRGANGSGKTSLLRCIAGLIDTAKGEILLGGDVTDPALRRRASVYCGHSDGLRTNLTVFDQCQFFATLYGWSGAPNTINQIVDAAGLSPEALVQNLSAGQRRRVALATLPLLRRRIWLLDEPTAPLDQAGAEWAAGLIATHLDLGGIAIVASHSQIMPKTLPEFWLTPQEVML